MKNKSDIVRSSAAEYLTFIAAHGEGSVEAVYADEDIWLSQKMMGTLYSVDVRTINYHLKKIFSDSELEENSVIQDFRITAKDGKQYNTKHYNLSAIIAVGYKVNSERAVQFRKWATTIIKEFTIKGFTMDDERLKNDGTILGKKYFEEQLQRIREIRLSERKFYQKITDIYITAIDYDVTAQATKRFFATVQNKLHWAIHGQTAAEVIVDRVSHKKENMGLTAWNAAYFVTICTKDRDHNFGKIANDKMILSPAGIIADVLWYEIKNHAKNVELDVFQVMPNHIHGIIVLNGGYVAGNNDNNIDGNVETRHALSLRYHPRYHPEPTIGQTRFQNQGENTLSSIIGSYKSAVTKHANRLGLPHGWQSRFHDHIVRNDDEFNRIRNYIINNPVNWKQDKFNNEKEGANG